MSILHSSDLFLPVSKVSISTQLVKYQNGVVERRIKEIGRMARAMIDFTNFFAFERGEELGLVMDLAGSVLSGFSHPSPSE
jgi:hypothetical protein